MKSLAGVMSRYGSHLLLLVLVASLTCVNQLFLKAGVSRGGPIDIGFSGLLVLVRRIFTTPLILAGYAVGALTGLLWLTALSRLEISLAAPAVTGLYFILMLCASRILLAEAVTAERWAGVLLILGGIFLLARK